MSAYLVFTGYKCCSEFKKSVTKQRRRLPPDCHGNKSFAFNEIVLLKLNIVINHKSYLITHLITDASIGVTTASQNYPPSPSQLASSKYGANKCILHAVQQ